MSLQTIEPYYKSLDGQHVNYLIRWKLEPITPTPEAPDEEQELKWDAADRRIKINTGGGTVETVAWLTDLQRYWRNRGTYGVGGRLPTPADARKLTGQPIEEYDTFLISNPITIPGIQGDQDLGRGGLLIFVGGDPLDVNSADQWLGIDDDAAPVTLQYEEQTTDLAADTPKILTATMVTDIKDIVVRDATNLDISSQLVISFNGTSATLQSNTGLTGLRVFFHG